MSSQDVKTGTFVPEITKIQTKYVKRWFLRHSASVNKRQWSLRGRKQMRGAPQLPRRGKVSSPWHIPGLGI